MKNVANCRLGTVVDLHIDNISTRSIGLGWYKSSYTWAFYFLKSNSESE